MGYTFAPMPLVSAVMIFFNSERFITEAVESLFAQTFNDWELVLVDDGSTDASTAIAKSFAQRRPDRIRYLDHPGHANRGMSASRNAGIRISSGPYIAMLDSDDAWQPHRLERHVEILSSQPEADMVYGVGLNWYSWADPSAKDIPHRFERGSGLTMDGVIQPPALIPVLLLLGAPDNSSWLARRKAGDRIGWYEESFTGTYEDAVFFAKFFFENRIYADNNVVIKHRVHPHSHCSLLSNDQWHSERLRFLSWFESRLISKNVEDSQIWSALRRDVFRARQPTFYQLHPAKLLLAAKRRLSGFYHHLRS
jgi:glycosyltransferase involved in cell wall biosynthesis